MRSLEPSSLGPPSCVLRILNAITVAILEERIVCGFEEAPQHRSLPVGETDDQSRTVAGCQPQIRADSSASHEEIPYLPRTLAIQADGQNRRPRHQIRESLAVRHEDSRGIPFLSFWLRGVVGENLAAPNPVVVGGGLVVVLAKADLGSGDIQDGTVLESVPRQSLQAEGHERYASPGR